MTTSAEVAALNPMRFEFDERKAAAAAAFVLSKHGGRMPYIHLIKLLYLADRESIDRRGRPIIGGRYVSMNYGPVLSAVLDLVRTGGPKWSQAIEKESYDVRLLREPDLGPLSEEEVDLLAEAVDLHRALDRWKLCELTHGLPEWKDPKGSAIDITPEDIFRALAKRDEAVEEARQDAQERAYFDDLFGR